VTSISPTLSGVLFGSIGESWASSKFQKQSAAKSVGLGATKNPPRSRSKLSHAPDAARREYRGKNAVCKKYFTLRLSLRAESRNL
jgi:hypothetical protein